MQVVEKSKIVKRLRSEFCIAEILHPNALFAKCRNGTKLVHSATTKDILVGIRMLLGGIDTTLFSLKDWNVDGTHQNNDLDIVEVKLIEECGDEAYSIIWDIVKPVEQSTEETLREALKEFCEKGKALIEMVEKALKKPKPIQLYGDSITRKGLNIYSVFEYARENPGEVRFRTRNGEEWDVRNFASWKVLMGTFTEDGLSKNSSFEDITSIVLNDGGQIRIAE